MSGGTAETGAVAQINLTLTLATDPELDPEAAERLARQLRAELAELDVDSVSSAPGDTAPVGAKSPDPVTVGAIIVAMSASGGVFTAIIETVRDWLGRHSGRHQVSITIDGDVIELERATADQQRDLVDAYIRRHSDT